MLSLQQYGSDASDNEDDQVHSASELTEDHYLHLQQPSTSTASAVAVQQLVKPPDLTPAVNLKEDVGGMTVIDPTAQELNFNPKFDQLFAPVAGPVNPHKTEQMKADKNVLSGYAEEARVNDFHFEKERRTFDSFGYALDPSTSHTSDSAYVGDAATAKEQKGTTVFESTRPRPGDLRKRHKNMDSSDIDGYTGPWGKYVDEQEVSKPDEETMKVLESYAMKRKKFTQKPENEEETCVEQVKVHIKDPYDYQGRSFLHAPHDVGVNLRNDSGPEKCFIPKKLIHTWSGHKKSVQAIRWFPNTAHLMLSAGMDSNIKLWEVYKDRRCVCTYSGHNQAVRDVAFSNDGAQFLSASYDRNIKLWDTETGQVKLRLTTGKVPFCLKFNPDEDKQHMVLSGMGDKKIIQWDLRSSEIVQEYDRHLGAVNTITFFDENRRFCTTSDDKSMRIWEWEIPVDTKLIQDASMHSMPAITMAPNSSKQYRLPTGGEVIPRIIGSLVAIKCQMSAFTLTDTVKSDQICSPYLYAKLTAEIVARRCWPKDCRA